MVTPDGVLAGGFDRIIHAVERDGFRVEDGQVVQLDVDILRRMYHHSDDPPGPTGARDELPVSVLEVLYREAPACVVVLSRVGSGSSEALGALKGATRPAQALAGSIRERGEHLIFNTIHSPDDAASAKTELGYVVGHERAGRMLEEGPSDPLPWLDLVGAQAIRQCLPATAGWEALSFPMIANRIRSRIVQELAHRANRDLDIGRALLGIRRSLMLEREQLLGCRLSGERLAIAQHWNDKLHEGLIRADGSLRDGLSDALIELRDLLERNRSRRSEAIERLPEAGIYLGRVESMAIDAHRHAMWADDDLDVIGSG
jgi:nucleoside diphosphate kinase